MVAQQDCRVIIRLMVNSDRDEVLNIEERSFGNNPWTQEDFDYYLGKQRSCVGFVAAIDERVVAFFIYELYPNPKTLCLINIAVHPYYRGQGIGQQCMDEVRLRAHQHYQSNVEVLIPNLRRSTASFFERYHDVKIRFTQNKGEIMYKSVLAAMTVQDAEEAQGIENELMAQYQKTIRDIPDMISNSVRYGMVVRDGPTGELLEFMLYARETRYIDVNGVFGIIVKPKCRGRGIGQMLMMALANENLPIRVSDIYFVSMEQFHFLKKMGITVPKQPITVTWQPPSPTTEIP